jgi:hypothetical protein
MRYWKGSFTISLDKRATCGSIGCFGIRPTCEYQRDAGKRVSLSHWIIMQHAVVSSALAYDQPMSTDEMLESESRYLTG